MHVFRHFNFLRPWLLLLLSVNGTNNQTDNGRTPDSCINLLKHQDNSEYSRIIYTAAIQSYVKSQRRVVESGRITARTLRLLVAERVCRHLAITVKASNAERPVVAPLCMKRAVGLFIKTFKCVKHDYSKQHQKTKKE